jgi:hypothetical protein
MAMASVAIARAGEPPAMASSLASPCPCCRSCAPATAAHTTRTRRPHNLSSQWLQSAEKPVQNALKTSSSRARVSRRGGVAVRALELDQDTLVAISVAVAGLAVGIGVPIFYETQVKGAEVRENDQPCFPCKGTGSQTCRFCVGAGNITVELGGGEKEVSRCINCEGSGALTCTTCQGSGVQPRYLDRREYKDDD